MMHGGCISESPILGRFRFSDEGFVNLFDGMVTAEDTGKMVSEIY